VPFRCYDPELQQEPFVYRLIEAINHYGDGLKLLANEKCGDGIISAIDFYVTMDQVKGTNGEDRLVVSLNGKFLPHIEQRSENNTFKPQA
jgi:cyanate lyase